MNCTCYCLFIALIITILTCLSYITLILCLYSISGPFFCLEFVCKIEW